jgi:uncharacterized membrane protein
VNNESPLRSPAFRIASIAILAAVTTVFTLFVRVPSPARGYFNLGDVAIAFAAFTFGPISALIAGGLGTALADLIGSYAQWAPISLVVHGLQGLAIGLIARFKPGNLPVAIVAGIAGTAVMVIGYGAGGVLLTGIGPALAEAPGNLVQSAAGVILGIPLSLAVARAYPPVRMYTW